jgi:ribosomal protein S27E
MALFTQKSEAERAADAARKAEAAFWVSPQGKAATAFERGDEFFQIEIPHSSVTGFTNAAFNSSTKGKIRRGLTRTDLLGQIEETGWRLQHADWVYVQTGQNSRDKFLASGQHVIVTGEVIGIYLFRRDDTRVDRAAGPKRLTGNRTSSVTSEKSVLATKSDEHATDTVTVKCFECQHSQTVLATQRVFPCERCGTQLKRKSQPEA